jgi:hypothetical protein
MDYDANQYGVVGGRREREMMVRMIGNKQQRWKSRSKKRTTAAAIGAVMDR